MIQSAQTGPVQVSYVPGDGLAVVRGGVAVLLSADDRGLALRCHEALADDDPVEGVLGLLLGHGLYAAPSFAIARLGEESGGVPGRFVVRGDHRVAVSSGVEVHRYHEARGVADRDCGHVDWAVLDNGSEPADHGEELPVADAVVRASAIRIVTTQSPAPPDDLAPAEDKDVDADAAPLSTGVAESRADGASGRGDVDQGAEPSAPDPAAGESEAPASDSAAWESEAPASDPASDPAAGESEAPASDPAPDVDGPVEPDSPGFSASGEADAQAGAFMNVVWPVEGAIGLDAGQEHSDQPWAAAEADAAGEPETPAHPETPAQPDEAVRPEPPAQPRTPAQPDEAVRPEPPAQPGTPAGPESFDEPEADANPAPSPDWNPAPSPAWTDDGAGDVWGSEAESENAPPGAGLGWEPAPGTSDESGPENRWHEPVVGPDRGTPHAPDEPPEPSSMPSGWVSLAKSGMSESQVVPSVDDEPWRPSPAPETDPWAPRPSSSGSSPTSLATSGSSPATDPSEPALPFPPVESAEPARSSFIDSIPFAPASAFAPPGGGSDLDDATVIRSMVDDPGDDFDRTVVQMEESASTSPGQMVWAARCPSGHLTLAFQAHCRVCRQVVPPQDPVEVPRPTLGRLVASTGQTVDLDRDAFLGRAPRIPADYDGPEPHVIRLVDPSVEVSSQHLKVSLDYWIVSVTDLGSTNGTEVVYEDGQRLTLTPDVPVPIDPGTKVVLAGTIGLIYEAGT